MAWTATKVFVAGAVLTAAQMNTYVSGNDDALRTGAIALASQTIGDLPYASSTTQLGRIAAVATGRVLASAGAGVVPAWTLVPLVDGVQFPGTQVSSADANTLDDYEEGSWTPVIGGDGGTSGQTYSSQVGRYVKIGKWVFVQGSATLTAKGTITGNVAITGLPFTIENVSGANAVGQVLVSNLATNWVTIQTLLNVNTTYLQLRGATAAAASHITTLVAADVADNTFMFFSAAYRASA